LVLLHLSNHVMLLVALNQGVFFQKCLDPDCRSMDYRYGSRARAFLGSNRVLALTQLPPDRRRGRCRTISCRRSCSTARNCNKWR